MKTFKLLKTLNVIVSAVIGVLAVFIVANQFLPEIIFAKSNGFDENIFQADEPTEVLGQSTKYVPQITDDNIIVIPKIGVRAPITEGNDDSALMKGMWRLPYTSTPDLGGNTVITGHRVLYTSGPNTFYKLDKIIVGDKILVYWKGKEYVYKVHDTEIVSPMQDEIEFNTKDPILTLYTCTPAWTSKSRIVVKASLQ